MKRLLKSTLLLTKNHRLILGHVICFLLVACNSRLQRTPNNLEEALANGQVISLDESSSEGIINGTPVSSGDPVLSSTVALYDRNSQSPFCTGTLLTKNILVTAAHCLAGTAPNRILIGFGKEVDINKMQFRKVLGGAVNSTYLNLSQATASDPRSKNWGDIGLVMFEGLLPAGFSPALILNDLSLLKNGSDITLAGFGLNDGLNETATQFLMKTTAQIKNAKFSRTEVEVSPSNGHAACHGDSGGPAFIKLNERNVVFGATSRSATITGAKSCLEGSIYTVLTSNLTWLKTNIQKLNKITNFESPVTEKPNQKPSQKPSYISLNQ